MTLSVYQGTALGADRRVLDWPFHVRVMRETGGTPALAQVFKDEPGSMPLANPINVTADRGWQPGFFRFYAPAGRYRIQIYKGAEEAEELRHVALGTGAQVDLDTLLGSGFNMQFEAATDAPPEAGAIRANNADLSAATVLYVSEENAAGSSIAARLDELAAGDVILLTEPGGAQASFRIDAGGVSDNGAYRSIAVTAHDGVSSLNAGALVLQFIRSGASAASAVAFSPSGAISATNVQDALAELDSEKATPANIQSAIDDLVGAAPGALDTLNELAAALGDDPNFASSVAASLASKLALAGGTMTGPIGFTHQTSPANPSSGVLRVFAKNDNKLYTRTSSGAERALGGLSGLIEAAEFGVLANGTTDDYAALQAAATAAANKVLLLPAGTIMLSEDVAFPPNIRVVGIPDATWLKATSGNTSNPVLASMGGTRQNVVFDGVGFDGNLANVTTSNNVVVAFQARRIHFHNCRWKDTKGIAVIFSQCTQSGVEHSRFEDCGTYNRTTGLSSDRKQAIAFSGAGGVDNYANFNHFNGVGLDCISAATDQKGFLCVGNTIRDNDAGSIYISNNVGFRVANNDVQNGSTGGNAIDIVNSADGVVDGNVCVGNGAAGILVAGSRNVAVTGNLCKNNHQSGTSAHKGGITLAVPSGTTTSGIVISGNRCYDDQGVGNVTQRFAIGVFNDGGIFSRIKVANDNLLTGYNSSGAESDADIFENGGLGLHGLMFTKMGRGKLATLAALFNSSNVHTFGTGAAANDGTNSGVSAAGSSYFTQQLRVRSTSAAATGSDCGLRNSDWFPVERPGRVLLRFGVADYQTNCAMFAGIRRGNSGAHGNGNPSAFITCFGIGVDPGQTTWRLMHNDASGSCTVTDLGSNFPANTDETDFYELELWWADQTAIGWRLTRCNTGHVAEGIATSNLPSGDLLRTSVIGNTRTGSAALALDISMMEREAF